jgi:Uma2 family endonuclease
MGVKFDLYEENRVKEYWIVHPVEQTILIYTLEKGKYRGLKNCIVGEKITSPLFPELNFEISKIFED